jgi:hypothetical protein
MHPVKLAAAITGVVIAILVQVGLCARQGDNDATVPMLEVLQVGHARYRSILTVPSSLFHDEG